MALNRTRAATNGSAHRRCRSWIEAFVAHTDNLGSSELFRKWTAISTLAGVLEQKVWLTTTDQIFPNLYTILVAPPGIGKTRTIMSARKFLAELPDFCIAPTSMTMASLVDFLSRSSKKHVLPKGKGILDYHTAMMIMDEWSAFMSEYSHDIIGGLTTFYDVTVPYRETRITKSRDTTIDRPQLNMLAGSTPSNLMKFMPEFAWDQGFTSRIILVYSDEQRLTDDFAEVQRTTDPDLLHDLTSIYGIIGEFTVTKEYQDAIMEWRSSGEGGKPTHPKLIHYNSRRKVHLYKLSMVAAIDRGDNLILTTDCFTTALRWLTEVEINMPLLFSAGSTTIDGRAMEEIVDFIRRAGKPVPQYKVIHFACGLVPNHSVIRVLSLMEMSGLIEEAGEANGQKLYVTTD